MMLLPVTQNNYEYSQRKERPPLSLYYNLPTNQEQPAVSPEASHESLQPSTDSGCLPRRTRTSGLCP
jgi:hypothetical protein